MANPTQWEYASQVRAEQVRDAFSHSAGLPKKGRRASGGKHADVPETFTPGAPGWSEHVVNMEERTGGGPARFALQRAVAHVSPHEGKVVAHPVHGSVTLPVAAAAVARNGNWRPRRRKRKGKVRVRPRASDE